MNKYLYLLLASLPLILLVLMIDYTGSTFFGIGLIIYAVVYRPILKAVLLVKVGVLKVKEWYKVFNPFIESKYFV